jgi:hypothetical protein
LIKKNQYLTWLLIVSILSSLSACSYSFSGSSVPAHLKTIAIPLFADRSGSGEFDLSQKLTTQLTQKFIDDNTLGVGDRVNSNSILEGVIVGLDDSPTVVSGGASTTGREKITARRITITVNASFKDLVKKHTVFERNFSNYSDYIVGGDITSVRKKAIEDAIDKITEDILLGVVSNW